MQVHAKPKGGKLVDSMGADFLAIHAKTEYMQASWTLVDFMTGVDAQQLRSEMGFWCPVRKSVAKDPKAQAGLGVNKNFDAVFALLDSSRPSVDRLLRWNEVAELLGPALDLVYNGQKTAEEALTEVTKQINEVLSKPPVE